VGARTAPPSLNLRSRLRANVRAMSEGYSARSRRHREELSSDALKGRSTATAAHALSMARPKAGRPAPRR
jgi:hypothetical protein